MVLLLGGRTHVDGSILLKGCHEVLLRGIKAQVADVQPL